MGKFLFFITILGVSLFGCSINDTHQIAIITGGHDYDSVNFVKVFQNIEDLSFDHFLHPGANDIYACDSIDKYDALVFYDLYQDINEEQKKAFIEMLDKGKGLVFLHHSIASYQDWDEFMEILGARYYLQPSFYDGDSIPPSTYSHDQEVKITVLDSNHPVSDGIEDFEILDEVYGECIFLPDVKTLMTTDHSDSDGPEVWVNQYGKSRIVYIQLGHDNNAYSNPNFRKLVNQAINWVAN